MSGGLLSCLLAPHASALDQTVRVAEEVMEGVFGRGITEQEFEDARGQTVEMLREARASSRDYWLSPLLEHLQSSLAPKAAADVEGVDVLSSDYEALSLRHVNAVMKHCLSGFSQRMVVSIGVGSPSN